MTGLDSTALVQLGIVDHVQHTATDQILQNEVKLGRDILVAPLVIAEFLHIVTDPRRFTEPASMTVALDWIEGFLQNPFVSLAMPTEESIQKALEWMRLHKLGRKRVLDTQLAATLHMLGCERLVTSNPKDFEIFKVFELIVP